MWATIVEVMLGPEALNKLTNVFDVEKDPVKVEWLKKVMHRNFRSHNGCIYKDVSMVADTEADCSTHKGMCTIPTGPAEGPYFVSCGFVCKDKSKANVNRSQYKDSVAAGKGVTANTLNGVMEYLLFHRPPTALLENVADFVAESSTDWQELVKKAHAAGYAVKYCILDAAWWLPQRRRRVYIPMISYKAFGLSLREAEKLLAAACKKASEFKFTDGPLPWSAILHQDGDPWIAKELADMERVAAKRSEQPEEATDEAWHDKRLAEMTKAGVSFSVMGHDPHVASLKGNPWFDALTGREQASMAHLMAVVPNKVCIDISQSLDRLAKIPTSKPRGAPRASSSAMPSSSPPDDDAGLCRTLVIRSNVWYNPLRRCLTGAEKCALQGIPCSVLAGASKMQPRSLTMLAGDAFNGAAFSAIVLSMLLHIPVLSKDPKVVEVEDNNADFLQHLVWAEF